MRRGDHRPAQKRDPNLQRAAYRDPDRRSSFTGISLRTFAPRAGASADRAVIDLGEYQNQRRPLRVARTGRRVTLAVRYLSPELHSRVCERDRPRSRRHRAGVPRAISRSAGPPGPCRTAGLVACHRTPAAGHRGEGEGDAAAGRAREGHRHGTRVRPRPPADGHAPPGDRRGLRRRRRAGDRAVRLHRVREILAAAGCDHAGLLPGRYPRARQYSGRVPAGDRCGRIGTVQSAIR